MTALLALWLLSTPWCRRRLGYEFFRKAHYVLAMLFIGACWGHWQHLKVFLLPSLLLWGADRALRLLRTACIHYGVLQDGSVGFSTIRSSFQVFDDAQHGDVVRLDFAVPHSGDGWKVGSTFSSLSQKPASGSRIPSHLSARLHPSTSASSIRTSSEQREAKPRNWQQSCG